VLCFAMVAGQRLCVLDFAPEQFSANPPAANILPSFSERRDCSRAARPGGLRSALRRRARRQARCALGPAYLPAWRPPVPGNERLQIPRAKFLQNEHIRKNREGVGRPVSTSALTLSCANVHGHLPDALDARAHHVAWLYGADSLRSATEQHIAREEGIKGRRKFN